MLKQKLKKIAENIYELPKEGDMLVSGEIFASDELFKVIDWIDNVLDLPTKVLNVSKTSVDDKLKRLWKALNDNITGLAHVKEKVMEAMCAKIHNEDSKGKILALFQKPDVPVLLIQELM